MEEFINKSSFNNNSNTRNTEILLAKKQGQDPENRHYIDKSQNDCYPYHIERKTPSFS